MSDLLETGFPFIDDSNYFMSGANRPSEIHAISCAGGNPGVCAPELSEAALDAILGYCCADTKFFIDSGAFSEVEFNPAPQIMHPIREEEWGRRLGLYERLAQHMGPQLYCVAPDCVGHQDITWERLCRHRLALRRLLELHVHLIIPLQRGRFRLSTFARMATELLVTKQLVWGLPMRKGATSIGFIKGFCDWLFPQGFTKVHLLGMGVYSPDYLAVLKMFQFQSPGTTVFSDSGRVKALAGHTNGPGGGPRALTRELSQARLTDRGPFNREDALKRVLLEERAARVQLAKNLGWFTEEEEKELEDVG
jgi:hypothetical protein